MVHYRIYNDFMSKLRCEDWSRSLIAGSWAVQIDLPLFLFIGWFATRNNALWISTLISAVVFGGTTFFWPQLFLPYRRRSDPSATAIEVQATALFHFTLVALLLWGRQLSAAIAGGILVLVVCALMLFSVFSHRRDKSPWLFAVNVSIFMGIGAGGIALIYINPSFDLNNTIPVLIGILIGDLIISFVRRYRSSWNKWDKNPEDNRSVTPRRTQPLHW